MSQALINQLRAKSLILVTAESCTGGLIASMITAIAGASATFDRGYITYSNEAKIECLDVSQKITKDHGAVSSQTAAAMAEGALKNSHANIAITTTGIAGPDGGSKDKPIGLVYFGLAQDNTKTQTYKKIFQGSRTEIQQAAADYAIELLLKSSK